MFAFNDSMLCTRRHHPIRHGFEQIEIIEKKQYAIAEVGHTCFFRVCFPWIWVHRCKIASIAYRSHYIIFYLKFKLSTVRCEALEHVRSCFDYAGSVCVCVHRNKLRV